MTPAEVDALSDLVAKNSGTDQHAELREAVDFVALLKRKDASRNFNAQVKKL